MVAQSTTPGIALAENGLVGRLFVPEGAGQHPAVIVLGGSEGGVEWSVPWGIPLAERGFVALALAYFGTDPLPARLQSIPLEYFSTAIDWVRRHPRVDPDRVGLMGFSKGAEGALLVAATHPTIRAVVAAAPSHVTWPGITGDPRVAAPSWTRAGATVPFVPYDLRGGLTTPFEAYTRSLANASAVTAAEIPVERINGPVLLVSGKGDRLWPSTLMAERVVERLRRHDFRFDAFHLQVEGAGHAALTARAESSRATIQFLERALSSAEGRRP